MKKITLLIFLFTLSLSGYAQEEYSLEKCYDLVEKNFPLAKQGQLLSRKNELDLAVIDKSKRPVFDLSAQATYQSEVTHVPLDLPNMEIPKPNKDQYKVALSVNQLIYGGGAINSALQLKKHELKTQQQEVEVSLFQIKQKINQLYFSVLLLQEKKELLKANQSNLKARLKEVESAIKYGALPVSSADIIEVEVLKIQQLFTEIEWSKKGLLSSLAQLVGEDISENTVFKNPVIEMETTKTINRPEMALFQLKKQQIDLSEKLIAKKNSPKVFGFGTGGYGNPGLNMLDNSFQPYYMVGLKVKWTVFDWNTAKTQRKALLLNKEIIDNQQEVFELNTSVELTQQEVEINKITSSLASDNTIIELRKKIVKTAQAQLKNGAITSSLYITELTKLFEAENKLNTHQIQLLLAKANYKTLQGI